MSEDVRWEWGRTAALDQSVSSGVGSGTVWLRTRPFPCIYVLAQVRNLCYHAFSKESPAWGPHLYREACSGHAMQRRPGPECIWQESMASISVLDWEKWTTIEGLIILYKSEDREGLITNRFCSFHSDSQRKCPIGSWLQVQHQRESTSVARCLRSAARGSLVESPCGYLLKAWCRLFRAQAVSRGSMPTFSGNFPAVPKSRLCRQGLFRRSKKLNWISKTVALFRPRM